MSENGNGQLTGLQRAFVDAWFGKAQFNATEAARLAGYSGGDDPGRAREVWASQGSRTLRNVKVQEEIAQRWADHGVTGEEVIARLTEQARATVEDFIDIIEPGRVMILNLEKARARGKLHLIKKLYWTESGPRLELYDAQRALELVGKTMGLFVDREEVSGPDGGPITVKLEDVLNGLPGDFSAAVREALADSLSEDRDCAGSCCKNMAGVQKQ